LFMGVVMYLIWARGKGFWPFVDPEFDAKFEDEMDQLIVFHDDYQQELAALKRKVDDTDRQITRLRKETKGVSRQLTAKDEELQSTIHKLGVEEFQIVSKYRKILATEAKIAELLAVLAKEEKKHATMDAENAELSTKIAFIQDTYGDGSGNDEFSASRNKRGAMKSAISELPVNEWGVEEVYFWWKTHLPNAAQSHIELVRECNLIGVDLLAVDEAMLEQFGMKKMIIHKVLKNIDVLREHSYADDGDESEHSVHKLKRSASSRRGARSKSRDRGHRV